MLSASQSLCSEICSLTAPSSQRHQPLISDGGLGQPSHAPLQDLVTIPHLPKASPASVCPHCSAVPAPYLPSGAGALWARVPDGHVRQGRGRRLSAFEGSLQQSRVCPAPTISACAVGDRGVEEHKGPQTIGRAGAFLTPMAAGKRALSAAAASLRGGGRRCRPCSLLLCSLAACQG